MLFGQGLPCHWEAKCDPQMTEKRFQMRVCLGLLPLLGRGNPKCTTDVRVRHGEELRQPYSWKVCIESGHPVRMPARKGCWGLAYAGQAVVPRLPEQRSTRMT